VQQGWGKTPRRSMGKEKRDGVAWRSLHAYAPLATREPAHHPFSIGVSDRHLCRLPTQYTLGWVSHTPTLCLHSYLHSYYYWGNVQFATPTVDELFRPTAR